MFKIPCNVVAVDGVVVVVTVMLGCPFGRLFVSRSRFFFPKLACASLFVWWAVRMFDYWYCDSLLLQCSLASCQCFLLLLFPLFYFSCLCYPMAGYLDVQSF